MKLPFTKMHGLGNDFIVLQGPTELTEKQVAKLCDRHVGIGADGLLIISPHAKGARMEYWNADGSTAEMCGNGLRCATRFAVEQGMVKPGSFIIETAVGELRVLWNGTKTGLVEAQVGKAISENRSLRLCDMTFYTASVGNPHAVTFVDDIKTAPVASIGPIIESAEHFPHKTNVEFAQIINPSRISLRIWERGVGETLACGTGMVATAAVANELGDVTFPVQVEVPGGEAKIWCDESGFACISGPAVSVFKGSMDI